MTPKDILRLRLAHQHLSGTPVEDPVALVRRMGCIQAQDFAAAKWAIGNRVAGATEVSVDEVFQSGQLLRTHVLRPTWHFVAPEDIRWMLKLTGPRIRAFSKGMHKSLGITDRELVASKRLLARTLEGGATLTRMEVKEALKKGRVNTDDIRLAFHLMDAEVEGLICSGGRRGKQFTYCLLEDRVPAAPGMDHEAALAELVRRYFVTRGPATLRDFAWWSGFSLGVAQKAMELSGGGLRMLGSGFWGYDGEVERMGDKAYLLPAFDEYMVAYSDRSALLDPMYYPVTGHGLKPAVVYHGRLVGTWRRVAGQVQTEFFQTPGSGAMRDIERAVIRYRRFLRQPLAARP